MDGLGWSSSNLVNEAPNKMQKRMLKFKVSYWKTIINYCEFGYDEFLSAKFRSQSVKSIQDVL